MLSQPLSPQRPATVVLSPRLLSFSEITKPPNVKSLCCSLITMDQLIHDSLSTLQTFLLLHTLKVKL